MCSQLLHCQPSPLIFDLSSKFVSYKFTIQNNWVNYPGQSITMGVYAMDIGWPLVLKEISKKLSNIDFEKKNS